MMKFFSFVLLLVLFCGCDPVYHIAYCVKNESEKTVFIVDKSNPSAKKIIAVKPGEIDTLMDESGVGYPKPVFNENVKNLSNYYVYFSDSLLADSTMFAPKNEWKYSEKKRFEGVGELVIVNDDVK